MCFLPQGEPWPLVVWSTSNSWLSARLMQRNWVSVAHSYNMLNDNDDDFSCSFCFCLSHFPIVLLVLLRFPYLWSKLGKSMKYTQFSSVQFSCSIMSDSWPQDWKRSHESQHTRPPCPSPTPGVHPNSCPSSRWCHPSISSSVVPFSSCPQSGSFPMSQLFAWGGQNTGVSASASVLPMNTQGLISFRMDWLDLLAVQDTLKSLLQHHSSKASILLCSAFFTVQLSTTR